MDSHLGTFVKPVAEFSVANLKAYYKFDMASGNMVNQASAVGSSDAVANSEMINVGTTYGVTGIIDDALSYDGTNDQSSADNSLKADWKFLNVNGAVFTVVFWFKADAFTSTETLLCTTNFSIGLAGILIEMETSRAFRIHIGKHGTDKIDWTTGVLFPNDTVNFHMIMVRYDDTTGVVSISVDDGTIQTLTGQNLTNTQDPSAVLFIGQDTTGAEYMGADMDECSVWNRYLSDDEITNLYNSGSALAL